VESNIQLARYDSSDQGFYNWHTDFAGFPLRKISVSIHHVAWILGTRWR
jgi:hypothetical protein